MQAMLLFDIVENTLILESSKVGSLTVSDRFPRCHQSLSNEEEAEKAPNSIQLGKNCASRWLAMSCVILVVSSNISLKRLCNLAGLPR